MSEPTMSKGCVRVFQYGSNMNPARLNSRERLNNKAKKPRVARLDGWGIRFDLYSECNGCGVTDITDRGKAASEYVLGVLYDVPVDLVVPVAGGRSRMDEIEGAKPDGTGNYRRIPVTIQVKNGRRISAITYAGTGAGRERFKCKWAEERQVSQDYFRHLERAAGKFRFPPDYRAYLREKAGALACARGSV
jgi:Gamma-glutamyl cyclotransferase, AIG2-like